MPYFLRWEWENPQAKQLSLSLLRKKPGVMRPRESVLFADFEYKITLANVK